jgi:hypothetical protein
LSESVNLRWPTCRTSASAALAVSEKSLPGVDPAAERDISTLDGMESLDASADERNERHHREFMERLDRLVAAVEALARAAGTGRHEAWGRRYVRRRPTAFRDL